MESTIKSEKRGPVALVTIENSPVNALNSDAYFQLYQTMYNLAVDDEVKAVVLTGHGEKAFVAGADVKEFISLDSKTGEIYTKKNSLVREYIRTFPKPVICAVNGIAYGGGCALALVCDIRIACESAKFSLSEINMGILGGIPYAASVMMSGTVRKMVYSGEAITAQEALRAGLIEEIVPRELLMSRCMELAEKIAAKPPCALRLAKQCLVAASEKNLTETAEIEANAITELWGTQDKNEAVTAFLEKRQAVFSGK
jgi:enoyl-CoA hydratase